MLILFDIDMTLLESDHIGIELLEAAGRDLHNNKVFTAEGISFGGGLDPVIISQMLTRNGVVPNQVHIDNMRRHYHAGLEHHASQNPISRALPGAHDLVNATISCDTVHAIGVLTGNYPETGSIKLASAGFNPDHFEINAWGDASPHPQPHRSHLPPVAIENFARAKNRSIEPEHVIIVGDTIHDVTCALDNNCRVLAVATGHASRQELEDAGAHRVVDDLKQTSDLLDWMLTAPATR